LGTSLKKKPEDSPTLHIWGGKITAVRGKGRKGFQPSSLMGKKERRGFGREMDKKQDMKGQGGGDFKNKHRGNWLITKAAMGKLPSKKK